MLKIHSSLYMFVVSALLRRTGILFILISIFQPSLGIAQSISKTDSLKIFEYLLLGDDFLNQEKFDSAEIYYKKGGTLAKQLNFPKGYAEYFSYYTFALNRQGKYQESLNLNLEAIEHAKQMGERKYLGAAYNNIGNSYIYLGDYKSAGKYIIQALEIAEETGDLRYQQNYSNNLASVFLSLQEKEKSLFYANKSFKLAQELKDSLGMASSLVNMAVAETYNNRTAVASNYLKQVLEIGLALNDLSYVMDAYINLADIEIQEKRYLAGLKYYQKAQETLKSYPAPDYELYIYMGLAQCYKYLKMYNEAQVFANKAVEVGSSINALDEIRRIYLVASEINELLNEPKIALDFRKKYELLHDSLINEETKNNIHRLEIEFQAAQKEKALAEQDLIIATNNLELQKQSKLIYLVITIVIGLFSIFLISIIIFRSRQKADAEKLQVIQKQNELKILTAMMEGEEKERVRLAKELHDGVGGVLSAAKMHMSIFKNEDTTPNSTSKLEQVLSLLNYASQEIRTIAHNLSPHILTKYDFDKAVTNFCESISNQTLKVECYILGEFPQFNNSFKLIVYRLVQELINNIIKHAEASQAIVQMSYHDQMLSITVEDDGIGFELENVEGFGLANIQQRVQELNGNIEISSRPGNGTTIYIEFDTASVTNLQIKEVAIV